MRLGTRNPTTTAPLHRLEPLTPKEKQVLELVGEGKTNREVATELGISRGAVRFHLKRVHSKLDTESDRGVLARLARLSGLVPFWRLPWTIGQVGSAAGIAMVGATLTVSAFVLNPGEVEFGNGNEPTITYIAWDGSRLNDFAVPGRISISELQELNPGIGLGPLESGTEVIVPELPDGQRAEVWPTSPTIGD